MKILEFALPPLEGAVLYKNDVANNTSGFRKHGASIIHLTRPHPTAYSGLKQSNLPVGAKSLAGRGNPFWRAARKRASDARFFVPAVYDGLFGSLRRAGYNSWQFSTGITTPNSLSPYPVVRIGGSSSILF